MATLLFSDKFTVLMLLTGAELDFGTLVVSFVPSSSNLVYDDGNQPLTLVPSCSPYSQPSFSSDTNKVMTSPWAKLRRVWLVPAVCGKMVLTFCFFIRFSPVATDTDRCKLGSSAESVELFILSEFCVTVAGLLNISIKGLV